MFKRHSHEDGQLDRHRKKDTYIGEKAFVLEVLGFRGL